MVDEKDQRIEYLTEELQELEERLHRVIKMLHLAENVLSKECRKSAIRDYVEAKIKQNHSV